MSLRFPLIAFVFMIAAPCLLQAQDAGSHQTLSLTGAVPTLDQEFKEETVWRAGGVQPDAPIRPLSDPDFSWAAGYIWDHPPVGGSTAWPPSKMYYPAWTSNGNADADPDGDMIAKLGPSLSPLTGTPGRLNFTVRPMPPEVAETINKTDPKDYLSASISSFPFAQLYGVFAMSAKLPAGKGIWPAFWLLPADKSWPPEIDIMEVLGKDPTVLYTTVHTNFPAKQSQVGKDVHTHVDLSADFHEYAVDWGPDRIDWYLDRKLVFSQPTPPDLHKPCYVIANLAVGKPGQWGGPPDGTTKFPATMQVAFIKAWQRPGYLSH